MQGTLHRPQRFAPSAASESVPFDAVRAASVALASPLSAEDCALQSMPDASPVKWHLGHTTWFFETFLLEPSQPGYRVFDPSFRVLFNSYYEAVGERHPRPQRGLVSRPGLDTVLAYRAHVDAAMRGLLAGPPERRVRDLVALGLHHEQQHQELMLTDVKHLLSHNPQKPAYRAGWPLAAVRPRPLVWHRHEGGIVHIGHDHDGFAFDNEAPSHRVLLEPFELASRPVTHGEFAEFIDDGGYRRAELWLSLGFDTVRAQHWTAPLYWVRDDDAWRTFTLHGMADIDPHAPMCHLSYFEADAYARWSGARLPTEFEWEAIARDVAIEGNFVESGALHPVAASGDRESCELPEQLFGDVWEWTSSSYGPYPRYRPASGAVGEYNGKFMCNQYVLRGGSCVTPASHVRATYRNFFPPDARWQFSGLRLARDCA
jgi:ergothioneine biosynthesis protein EgtB